MLVIVADLVFFSRQIGVDPALHILELRDHVLPLFLLLLLVAVLRVEVVLGLVEQSIYLRQKVLTQHFVGHTQVL